MDGYDSSDDLDDDWFYESVTRYNTLQMFYLQNIPEHVLQLDEFTLCLANRNDKCNSNELLELRLPGKLTMLAQDEGRSKENDFKMVSGLYTKKPVAQMGALREERKIITSQKNRKGLQIYNLQNNDRDEDPEHQIFPSVDWETPVFTVNEHKKDIICWENNCEHLTVWDATSEDMIREIKHPFGEASVNGSTGIENSFNTRPINFQLLNENILLVVDVNSGGFVMIDLRTDDTTALQGTHNSIPGEFWTLSISDFNTCTNYFGVLSNKGKLCLFDMRNRDKSIKNNCFQKSVINDSALKLKVANGDRLSISGIDSNIYIYNVVRDNIELTFTHNGHSQKKGRENEDLVSDHIWLTSVGRNFLVSICSNRSLNCWEYNE